MFGCNNRLSRLRLAGSPGGPARSRARARARARAFLSICHRRNIGAREIERERERRRDVFLVRLCLFTCARSKTQLSRRRVLVSRVLSSFSPRFVNFSVDSRLFPRRGFDNRCVCVCQSVSQRETIERAIQTNKPSSTPDPSVRFVTNRVNERETSSSSCNVSAGRHERRKKRKRKWVRCKYIDESM